MKTFFVFALLTVGMTSASLVPTLEQIMDYLVGGVDSVVHTVTTPIFARLTDVMRSESLLLRQSVRPVSYAIIKKLTTTPTLGSGNTGCSPNPNCTQYVREGLATAAAYLIAHSPAEPDASSPFDTIISYLPGFTITLTKDICSTKIDSMTRRDSLQLKTDNFRNEMFIDLASEATQLLNTGAILQSIFSKVPCVTPEPQLFDETEDTDTILSPSLIPSLSIANCLPSNLTLNVNVSGSLSVVISGLLADGVYTAHSGRRWIANSAHLELNQMVLTNKTCNGSPLFNVACECLLKTDAFVKFLYRATEATYICLFQQFLDSSLGFLLKCPYF